MASAAPSASERVRALLGELLCPPRELADAEAILIARWMERNGFRYPRAEVRGRDRPGPSTVVGSLAGTRPLSSEEAQAHGYRYRVNRQLPPGEDAQALVEEYLATLYGGLGHRP